MIQKTEFTLPPDIDSQQEYFIGCWSPEPLTIKASSATDQFCIVRGENYVLLAPSRSDHGNASAVKRDGPWAGAFRGYVLDPLLHTYSADASVITALQNNRGVADGVYSCALVSRDELMLSSDVLGFGPIYYRRRGKLVMFATNPRFLACVADEPDLIAWRSLIHWGSFAGDRTLTKDVLRLAAGSQLRGSSNGVSLIETGALDELPAGTKNVTDESVVEVEAVFQRAMDRLLKFNDFDVCLPLSSGHDSRRILSSLCDRSTPFTSWTVRVRQKGHRDLDAAYAAEMAESFNFPHNIIELDDIKFLDNDRLRRLRTDCETRNHTWSMNLFNVMSQKPSLLFDGILGDILGNPGFRIPGLYESNSAALDIICNDLVPTSLAHAFRDTNWPSADDVKADIARYMGPFMERPNMVEFAFILLRQRRMTSIWSQQLVPGNHLVACPFLDGEYLRTLLKFDPEQKHTANFQRWCLTRFWPEYAAFPGNRDIPGHLPEGNPRAQRQLDHDRYLSLISNSTRFRELLASVHWSMRWREKLSRNSATAWHRIAWVMDPLAELNWREENHTPCWTFGTEAG